MKLHRLSIPYRIAQRLGSLVAVLFGAPILLSAVVDDPAIIAVATGGSLLLVVGISVGWELAYYRRYEYELTDDTFDIHSGVLSRRDREIPYARIQNVSINRNVVQRALGLAEVRLETAGGQGAEAHLRYVGHEQADRLQNEVSERKRAAAARRDGREQTDPDADTTEREVQTLYEIDGTELAVLGIVSFDFRFLSLLFVLVPTFGERIVRVLAGADVGLVVLAAPVGAIVLYLVSALVSGLYAVTNYYGFTLTRSDDELRYERGLLQRFSGTIPLEKVQSITLTENLLARQAGYAALLVETAGFSPDDSEGSQSAIPIAKRDRVRSLAEEIEPHGHAEFQRPPKRSRERYLVRYLLVVAVLTGLIFAGTWALNADFPWYATLLLALLAPPAAHLKWRNRGYALGERHVITRNGFWSRRTIIVPYHRIQTVADTRTFFQRRRSLATLTIDTAGASGLRGNDSQAVDIDADLARELREEITDRLLRSVADRRQEERRRRRRTLVTEGSDAEPQSSEVDRGDGRSTGTKERTSDSDAAATDDPESKPNRPPE